MHVKILKHFKNNFFCALLPFSVVVGVAVASYLVRCLQTKQFWSKPWPETLRCVLDQNT